MITYKIASIEQGFTSTYIDIHVKWNDDIVACIYYTEDNLISAAPIVHFDKWYKYQLYRDSIPTIDSLKVAQEIILEHYLL